MTTSTLLVKGEVTDGLHSIGDGWVDAIVTDPPYGLSQEPDIAEVLQHWLAGDDYTHSGGGFMGKTWDSFVPGPSVWRECLRVLKPGGYLLCFAGSRTVDLMGISLRLAGFEIRDQIQWLHSQGFPKSTNIEKALAKAGLVELGEVAGWGTALKPAHEPIIMARKPFAGTVANNVLRHGTGAINIDASRVATDDAFGGGAKATSGFVEGYEHDGWTPGPSGGRHPANVILDEGAAELLDEQSGDLEIGPKKQSGGASRFFYVAKANRAERTLPDGSMNTHPTIKPIDLMTYLTRMVTPNGGLVLDPFCGSGTTLVAAVRQGFWAIGIDRDDEGTYLEIARQRLSVEDTVVSYEEAPST